MSFNRAIYDPCAYNKRLDESTSVLTYNLDPNRYYNCNQCRVEFGLVGGNQVSLSNCNLVDVESDLRNQTRLYSLCPERKYLPRCNMPCKCNKTGLPCGSRHCRNEKNQHLPGCNLIQYKPRIDHVGYELNYPSCANHPTMVCPLKPERLNMGASRAYPGKQIKIDQNTTHRGYSTWAKSIGLPF